MSFVESLKAGIRAGFERFGYQIIKVDPPVRPTADSPYGVVFTDATYSPWAADQEFQAAFRLICQDTLVDIHRCYELWTLVDQCRNLDGALLEVGVWRGGTGALIGTRAVISGIKEPVYLCDTFLGVVKASGKDSFYTGGEHSDASRQQVERLVHDRMQLHYVTVLEGVFPDQTGPLIEDHCFRFCHIDVDVYRSASEILEWLWDRLVVGGIVVYDDYGFPRTSGITKHVDEQRSRPGCLVIHNLNGHAILIKLF